MLLIRYRDRSNLDRISMIQVGQVFDMLFKSIINKKKNQDEFTLVTFQK